MSDLPCTNPNPCYIIVQEIKYMLDGTTKEIKKCTVCGRRWIVLTKDGRNLVEEIFGEKK